MKTDLTGEDRAEEQDRPEDDGQEQEKLSDEEQVQIGAGVFSAYDWARLGPGFEEYGEAGFIAVRRKEECQVFDLVNLDWYRSSNSASSDPSSSSVDLWQFFKCGFSNQSKFDSDAGQAATISEVGEDEEV